MASSAARGALAGLFVFAASVPTGAQAPVDSALAQYIAGIRAIDAHAHPLRFVAAGAPPDTEYDALPLDGLPPFPLPWRLRLENPEWRAAQGTLFGATTADTGAAWREALTRAKENVTREHGAHYAEWILDRSAIDVMLANRIVLGAGLAPPRFRWVPFADPLMLPLDTRVEAARTPDTRPLYPREAALLNRYLGEIGVARIPATLDAYVATVVRPVLRRQRREGAVSVKFEAAYLRALDFDEPNERYARTVYARYAGGGAPTHAEYKALEDYLFRVICREAGREGMAIQIHVAGGFGGYYSPWGSAPHQLESAFNDSTLRATKFVIVHGGWPMIEETQSLLGKPNVYADISGMTLWAERSRLVPVLRQWLGEWPDKVLFGTDAFDGGPEQGWGELTLVGSNTARWALGAALTGMMHDGELSRAQAEGIARQVMRENASASTDSDNVRLASLHAAVRHRQSARHARKSTTSFANSSGASTLTRCAASSTANVLPEIAACSARTCSSGVETSSRPAMTSDGARISGASARRSASRSAALAEA